MNDYYPLLTLNRALSNVDAMFNEQYEYGTGFWCWVLNLKWRT